MDGVWAAFEQRDLLIHLNNPCWPEKPSSLPCARTSPNCSVKLLPNPPAFRQSNSSQLSVLRHMLRFCSTIHRTLVFLNAVNTSAAFIARQKTFPAEFAQLEAPLPLNGSDVIPGARYGIP